MANKFEDQLDKIRVELYERTKEMSKDEEVGFINENAEKIAEKYGITVVETLAGEKRKIV